MRVMIEQSSQKLRRYKSILNIFCTKIFRGIAIFLKFKIIFHPFAAYFHVTIHAFTFQKKRSVPFPVT